MNRSTVVPTGRTVLVVEDEAELSRLFIEVLQEAGHTAVSADSVTDALSALTGQRFDAAILDVELRDVPRAHQRVPFVSKPFDIRVLQQRVAEALATGPASTGNPQQA